FQRSTTLYVAAPPEGSEISIRPTRGLPRRTEPRPDFRSTVNAPSAGGAAEQVAERTSGAAPLITSNCGITPLNVRKTVPSTRTPTPHRPGPDLGCSTPGRGSIGAPADPAATDNGAGPLNGAPGATSPLSTFRTMG